MDGPYTIPDLTTELKFTTSRSSGPGGQNVNKLETKVELRWNIVLSTLIDESLKRRLMNELANFISKEGIFVLSDQSSRSQYKNKATCVEKFYSLLGEAIKEQKKRIKTAIPKVVKQKRLLEKKRTGVLKVMRRVDRNDLD